jgi:hypothetical protein
MSTHHCCDPAHRDLETRLRRMQEKLQEARTRARWAEVNEDALANEVTDLRERLGLEGPTRS